MSGFKDLFTHFVKTLTHRTPLARIDLCLIMVGYGVQYSKIKEYFQQSAKHGLIFQQAAEAEQSKQNPANFIGMTNMPTQKTAGFERGGSIRIDRCWSSGPMSEKEVLRKVVKVRAFIIPVRHVYEICSLYHRGVFKIGCEGKTKREREIHSKSKYVLKLLCIKKRLEESHAIQTLSL